MTFSRPLEASLPLHASAEQIPEGTLSPQNGAEREGAIAHADRSRLADGWLVALAISLCFGIFLLDRMTTSSTMAPQLYPAALLALYGTRLRYVTGGLWLLIVVLIGAGIPQLNSQELDPGRGLSLLMVSITAVALVQLSKHERGLRRQALTDPLTGLLNRRSFLEFAAREAARSQRGGSMFAVMMLDIDHFKRVNDTYGHPVGDAVIKELADVAAKTLRPSDILARYGGEEFIITLPDTTQDQALIAAERLRRAVHATAVVGDAGAVRFTVSIGVATCLPNTSLKDAIARADKALYEAKQNGRDRVELNLAPVSPDRLQSIASDSSERAVRMTNRILVVDDEPEIRDLLANWLEVSGYPVVTAENAAAALRIVEADRGIDLVITDVVMPGELDGFDLGRRIEAIRPEIKTLYMSGYVKPSAVHPERDSTKTLLQKPFRLSDVLVSVAIALKS